MHRDDHTIASMRRTRQDEQKKKSASPPRRELLVDEQDLQYYSSEEPEFLIQKVKSPCAAPGKLNSHPSRLASLKNDISSYLFEYLGGFHIPTHFVRRESSDEAMVRRLESIPLRLRVLNYTFGDFAERFSMHEGSPLFFPVIEYYQDTPSTGVQWLNESHIYSFGILTPDEFRQVNRLATKANAVLRSLCDRRKLMLLGLHIGFGRNQEQFYLNGHLSPASCFIWDTAADNGVRRNRFMTNGSGSEEVYQELLDRLSGKV